MDYYGQDSGSEAWSERYEDCRGVERSVIVQTVVQRLENASWRRAGLRDPGSASEEVAAAAQEHDEGSTDAAENKGVMSQDTVAGLTKGTAAVLTEVKTEPVAKEKQGRNTEVFDSGYDGECQSYRNGHATSYASRCESRCYDGCAANQPMT
ncbi:hypothetical protein PPTG_07461 [Phytophthora nicotianae INRA-310]|uniref:Uncharacterized protein n=1 Tax=Phytophthora nicotianae (strain INRA-310) TaxID=761204 RepID=W2QQ83_PHYN3|nr:hypothetical protein PPTG_07461 [Phytophthora nicotianae INRA-310]ETN14405.1 hypothetical protein PPTG_07461 [Phytophthora nicotianae INRA-310]